MFSRRRTLLLGTPAAIIGAVVAAVVISRRDPATDGADNAEAPEVFVTVDATPPSAVDAIAYADPATLAPYAWPRLFGPDGNSIVRYPGGLPAWPVAGPPVLWRIPAGAGYSAPVVQADKLILFHRQGEEERIECRDTASGEPIWDFTYATEYSSPVAYSNGPYSTPAIVGDRVFAIGAEAKLHCLHLANGELLWSRDLKAEYALENTNYGEQEYYGFCPSPLPLGSALIVNVGSRDKNAGVVAFDQQTGETLWQATSDGASYATPVAAMIDGVPIAVVLSRDALCVLDPGNGEVLFREEFRAKNPDTTNASSPLVVGDMIFACGYGVGAIAVRMAATAASKSADQCDPSRQESKLQPEIVWQNRRALDAQYTNLFSLDGLVIGYPSRLRGTIAGVELATGKTRWKLATGYARGNGLLINGELIVLSEEGDLLRFSNLPDEPVLNAVIEGFLKGPCYTGPVFANGRMFLRTEKELVCVRLL